MGETTRTAEAKLELELEADPPTGALVTSDGGRRTFCGWIELAAAVEDWRRKEDGDVSR